jgi:hypothetical protein
MLNRIWHLIGVAAFVVGGVLAISRGPDGDAYSVLAFLVVVVGVAALTRAKPKACGRKIAAPEQVSYALSPERGERGLLRAEPWQRQLNGQSDARRF